MPEWFIVVLLGIIEGLTEFLPVSSTGHLIVASNFLELRDSLAGVFEIFIQIGAVVAVLAYYRPQLWAHFQALIQAVQTKQVKEAKVSQLILTVLIAFFPAALIGLIFEDAIDNLLSKPIPIAIALIVGGVMFIVVERFLGAKEEVQTPQSIDEEPLSLKQALIVGTWQILALIPGMSRSGMSILGGMLAGLDRRRATDFSFYLALPTLGAATVYKLVSNLDQLNSSDYVLLLLGAVVSGIVAWASIAWLLRYVSRNTFVAFGYYRIVVGLVILVIFML